MAESANANLKLVSTNFKSTALVTILEMVDMKLMFNLKVPR